MWGERVAHAARGELDRRSGYGYGKGNYLPLVMVMVLNSALDRSCIRSWGSVSIGAAGILP